MERKGEHRRDGKGQDGLDPGHMGSVTGPGGCRKQGSCLDYRVEEGFVGWKQEEELRGAVGQAGNPVAGLP